MKKTAIVRKTRSTWNALGVQGLAHRVEGFDVRQDRHRPDRERDERRRGADRETDADGGADPQLQAAGVAQVQQEARDDGHHRGGEDDRGELSNAAQVAHEGAFAFGSERTSAGLDEEEEREGGSDPEDAGADVEYTKQQEHRIHAMTSVTDQPRGASLPGPTA
jgi:hypothetical protein